MRREPVAGAGGKNGRPVFSDNEMIASGDEFLTVRDPARAQTRVRGSRFIARLAPVRAEPAAREFIDRIARKDHDASHHCFAYRLGLGRETVARSSDAGEPSGTAGRPILDAITSRGLTDVVVVVTRYFGGVKLGTGGLARAYRDCADRALDAAETVRKVLTREWRLRFPYPLTAEVEAVLERHGARTVDRRYGEEIALTVAVRRGRAAALREALLEAGRGRIEVEEGITG
jgi:uncharacterized YigZ family protein